MFISVSDAAKKFNLSKRRVQTLCEQGRISGAEMVSGVWLIPDTAEKPTDGRKKAVVETRSVLYDQAQDLLSVDDVCRILSISKATAKNWLRLGKLVPDASDRLFTRRYIDRLVAELRSSDSARLKSRRNKKSATGRALYKDYIHTPGNQKTVAELLELGVIENEEELLIVLADFAVQLYYQRRGIVYSDNNVLLSYLAAEHTDDYNVLIRDLLGDIRIDSALTDKLGPALSKELFYVDGEDALGFVYISLRDISLRKSSGAYYTPEKAVSRLIDSLFENDPSLDRRTICDPCCGTGNFLLSLGKRGIDFTHIYGQDVDPISVCLSRINIALTDPSLSAADLRSRIIVGNTYFETFEQKFDVILGNPPWGGDFSEEEARKCRTLFKTAAGKSIESYDLFIEKALSMLNPDGVLAFVLPEAILSVAAHDAVRRLMIENCSFKFITYLGNVFSGVQCPCVILGISPDHHHTAVGCKVDRGTDKFIISTPRSFPDTMLSLNVSDAEYACLNAIGSIDNAVYLKGNARFALGIVTGNNKDYISDTKQDDNEAVLKGSDIYRYGMNPPHHYIRYAPESFQQVAPTEVYRAKEKLLYRFICEVPVFTYDDRQTLSLNSCNILIPEIDGLDIKYVLAILNSSVAAFFISKRFHSVKLLRSHIEQMPIPMASQQAQASVIKKADRIMNSSENIRGLYEELDQVIMELFGLNTEQKNTVRSALKDKNLFLKAN